MDVRRDAFDANREYLTNQRRRNLPVGESRQGPSGEPATEPRENRQRDSRSTQETGCLAWTEKALTANGMTEVYGKRELCSKAPNISGVTISCDLVADPGLRKNRKAGGDISKEKSPLRFCARHPPRATHLAAVLFGLGIQSDIQDLQKG